MYAVVAILVLLTAVAVFARIEGNSTSHINDFSYHGDKLVPTSAAGLSFSKPEQFTSTAKRGSQNYSTQSFAHFSTFKYPLAYIFTFSYKDSHTQDKKYVRGINDFMDGTVKNSFRTQYINAIKKQVFDSYPGYDAKLSEPRKFTNANIKQNAWSFDLNITSSNSQIKPMQGKLIYVLGPGTIYYFSLMVTKDNWVPNMATWQAVLDSLKLNAG